MYMQWDPKVEVVLNENAPYFSKSYKRKFQFLENEDNFAEITDLWYGLPDKKSSVPEYLVFLDLGTDGMTEDRYYFCEEKYIQKIPNIVRMSAMVCHSNDFYYLDYDSIDFYEHDIVCNDKDQDAYTDSFLKLYYEYYNPLFLCHNGYRFDFSILFGNLLRMEKSAVHYLKCADTLQLYKHHFKTGGPLGNTDLFETYSENYPYYEYLYQDSFDNPNAFTRCQMLTLWTHNVGLPVKNFSVGLEFLCGMKYSEPCITDIDSDTYYSNSSDYSEYADSEDLDIESYYYLDEEYQSEDYADAYDYD